MGFGQYDQVWFGMVFNGDLMAGRVGEYEFFAVPESAPIILRIENRGGEYTFKYKHDPNEAWTVLAPQNYTEAPQYVGLMGRSWDTGSTDLDMDWSYFRLERWTEPQQMLSQPLSGAQGTAGGHKPGTTPKATKPIKSRGPKGTPTPTVTPTVVPTLTPTRTPSRGAGFRGAQHAGLAPGEAKPEGNVVLARYNLPQAASLIIRW